MRRLLSRTVAHTVRTSLLAPRICHLTSPLLASSSFPALAMTAVLPHPPRDHTPDPSAEYFDLLTPDGQPLGRSKLRSHVHRDGDWHRAVHIWPLHLDRRQILIQLRAACKDSFPSHWDVGCAGHLSAGESSDAAAVGELQEELGLQAKGEEEGGGEGDGDGEGRLQRIASLKREVISQEGRFVDREWVDVYVYPCRVECERMRLQEEEVAEVRWVDLDDYIRTLERGEAHYVPFPDLAAYKVQVFEPIRRLLYTSPHTAQADASA